MLDNKDDGWSADNKKPFPEYKLDEVKNDELHENRRSVLCKILIGGAALTGYAIFPHRWIKPVINTIFSPSQAAVINPTTTTGAPTTTTGAPTTTTGAPTTTTGAPTTTTTAPPPSTSAPPGQTQTGLHYELRWLRKNNNEKPW